MTNECVGSLIAIDSPAATLALERWQRDDDNITQPARRLARALLLGLLEHVTSTPAARWQLRSLTTGQPLAQSDDGGRAPSVSLSHSRAWVAVACSWQGSIGVDVEQHRPGRDLAGIAAGSFGPAEMERARTGGAEAFYRIWTLREATAKASGQGLAMVANKQDRAAAGPECGSWRTQQGGRDWWLLHERPQPGFSLALALRDAPETVAMKWWQP